MARKKTVIERKPLKIKKTRKLSEEAKEKLRVRLATMRAKKKPADYKNIAESVLALPDDDKYSFKNVKTWIKHSKDLVLEYNKIARSRVSSTQEAQKASTTAEHKKAYIRYMELYLKSGDWVSTFSGEDENQKVIPRCIAMAYYDDGTPKRSWGVLYPDINAVWTKEMDETMFAYMRDDTNYVPKKSGTIAITDKQFDSSI